MDNAQRVVMNRIGGAAISDALRGNAGRRPSPAVVTVKIVSPHTRHTSRKFYVSKRKRRSDLHRLNG
jgi:hypothetical protein